MQKLNIVSMDLTGPRKFCCARKRAYQEQEMMKIASSYLHGEKKYSPIILLQGDGLESKMRKIDRLSSFRVYMDSDTSSAILIPREYNVVDWVSFSGIGSAVVVPMANHYLSLFSVSLTKKKNLGRFQYFYQSFCVPENPSYTKYQIVGGVFPSKDDMVNFSDTCGLTDISSYFYSVSDELLEDRYSILLSNDIGFSDTTRHTGLVKAKYLKHCPISTKISL